MSQVIVTKDSLNAKREASRLQEAKISREEMFGRWRRNDITGKDRVAAGVGMALMPVVAIWAAITGVIFLVLTALKYLFAGIGKLVGGTRSLITGKTQKP